MTTNKKIDTQNNFIDDWVAGSVEWDKARWDEFFKISEEFLKSEIERLRK